MRMRKMLLGAAAAIAGVAWAGSAQAHTIEIMITSATPSGPDTTYGFELILTAGNGLANAASTSNFESGFILPDVAPIGSVPLTGSTTAAGDWSVSTTSAGGTPFLDNVSNNGTSTTISADAFTSVSAADSSGANDLVLKYIGTGLAPNLPTDNGRVLLTGSFTSSTSLATLSGEHTLSRDTSSAGIQVETFGVINAVPLPATASTGLSLFAGLGALVGLRKLTSRRSVA